MKNIVNFKKGTIKREGEPYADPLANNRRVYNIIIGEYIDDKGNTEAVKEKIFEDIAKAASNEGFEWEIDITKKQKLVIISPAGKIMAHKPGLNLDAEFSKITDAYSRFPDTGLAERAKTDITRNIKTGNFGCDANIFAYMMQSILGDAEPTSFRYMYEALILNDEERLYKPENIDLANAINENFDDVSKMLLETMAPGAGNYNPFRNYENPLIAGANYNDIRKEIIRIALKKLKN